MVSIAVYLFLYFVMMPRCAALLLLRDSRDMAVKNKIQELNQATMVASYGYSVK